MEIEEKVNTIMQVRKNHEHAGHIWLQGFHEIIDNARLDYGKIEEHVSRKLAENPRFTKFNSSSQMFKIMKALLDDLKEPIRIQDIDINSLLKDPHAKEKLTKKAAEICFFYVHLPVNEDYHLEFPLIHQSELCRFVYTTCDRCEGLEEHGFPEICLRQSSYFESNGPIFYDNRISVDHQSPELIKESYKGLEDFVKQCK